MEEMTLRVRIKSLNQRASVCSLEAVLCNEVKSIVSIETRYIIIGVIWILKCKFRVIYFEIYSSYGKYLL